MIILLFGQPAAGKTTIANLLHKKFSEPDSDYKNPVKIDGDRWRDVTQNKDYSREGRMRNIRGAFDMALYLELEGYTPIVSLVTPYEELREYMRSKALKTAFIHLSYQGDRGRNDRFVKDFEPPSANCLKISTSLLSEDTTLFYAIEYINRCNNITK